MPDHPHPAPYGDRHIEIARKWLPAADYPLVMDVFGGTGKIHDLPQQTLACELEPEWAAMHPNTHIGDATALTYPNGAFDAICTSPAWGNRLADKFIPSAGDKSKRWTYRISLGRELTEGSGASMQWGQGYRDLHAKAWAEAWRTIRPSGRLMINIANHIRGGEEQRVTEWHLATCVGLGFQYVDMVDVHGPRMTFGRNGQKRCQEVFLIVDKPGDVS